MKICVTRKFSGMNSPSAGEFIRSEAKMKKITATLIIVLFLVSTSIAGVYIKTGLDLLSDGQQWNNYFTNQNLASVSWHDVAYFQGYVSGVASAARNELNTPEGVQVDQLCKIVFQYLNDNTNQLHKPASDLIIKALKNAFPD